jgi:TetR/AcrR family transcriptional regulator, cholesterol catabolism regulator
VSTAVPTGWSRLSQVGSDEGRTTGRAEGKDVRTAILDAAVELFYAKGYDATGLQQVVDAAGCTKGAFYHYWDSKESLLLEIHDTFHEFGITSGRAVLERGLAPDEALHDLVVDLFRQLEVYQRHMTVVISQSLYTPYEKYPRSRELRDEYEQIVKSVIEDGVEQGVFRDDLEATNVMAFGVMAFGTWATTWYRPGGRLSAVQIGEMYARVIVDGLRAR